MAGEAFFVRNRGKIAGPYDIPKLKFLRDRGQLARFHELSMDKQSWAQAATFEELYPSVTITTAPAAVQKPLWHYADKSGRQIGPVDGAVLADLYSAGTIGDSTMVWHEGMDKWIPLSTPNPDLPLLVLSEKRSKRGGMRKWLAAGTAAAALIGTIGAAIFLLGKNKEEATPVAVVSKESENLATNTDPGKSKPVDVANPELGQAVYARLLRSAVYVERVGSPGYGSGALIDSKNRLVITNYHVVEENDRALVLFPTFRNGKPLTDRDAVQQVKKEEGISGRVVYRVSGRDLALIQLDRLPVDVLPLTLANSSAGGGQHVHALGGTPQGNDQAFWVYSSGTVRQVYRNKWIYDTGQECDATVLSHQIPTNLGNSGGPIVNHRSELVAVVCSSDDLASLVNFGIDISEVKDVLQRYARSTGTKLAITTGPP